MGYCFVPECNHEQESHTFSGPLDYPIYRFRLIREEDGRPRFVEVQKFWYHGNMRTNSPLYFETIPGDSDCFFFSFFFPHFIEHFILFFMF